VTDADRSNVRIIEERYAGYTSAPSWSPDGKKIASRSRSGDIFTINVDGSGVTNLTHSEGAKDNPSWSPDGKKIAFETYRNGSFGVYVIDADGTEQTLVSNVPHPSGWTNPSWSPDGERIVFVRGSEVEGDHEIVTIDPDGSDLKVINKTSGLIVGGPDWQPLLPKNKAECKKGGHKDFGFKKQSQCIKAVRGAS
jgi:Tol biopolymer transport system component